MPAIKQQFFFEMSLELIIDYGDDRQYLSMRHCKYCFEKFLHKEFSMLFSRKHFIYFIIGSLHSPETQKKTITSLDFPSHGFGKGR